MAVIKRLRETWLHQKQAGQLQCHLLPEGFNLYFDYDEALSVARREGKPLMIDFTGHACVNCRKREANVWTDKAMHDG